MHMELLNLDKLHAHVTRIDPMASCGAVLLALVLFGSACLAVGARPPNFVVFLADE